MRLTVNKDVQEMGMYELAHNCCYIENQCARYRDYDLNVDAREFARELMKRYAGVELSKDNEVFDEEIMDYMIYNPQEPKGLIAVFYNLCWAMADLREALKEYEDAEEYGRLMKLPFKLGDSVFLVDTYLGEDTKIEPYTVNSIGINKDCEIILKQDNFVICTLKNVLTDEPYAKHNRVFLTEDAAQEFLRKVRGSNKFKSSIMEKFTRVR